MAWMLRLLAQYITATGCHQAGVAHWQCMHHVNLPIGRFLHSGQETSQMLEEAVLMSTLQQILSLWKLAREEGL